LQLLAFYTLADQIMIEEKGHIASQSGTDWLIVRSIKGPISLARLADDGCAACARFHVPPTKWCLCAEHFATLQLHGAGRERVDTQGQPQRWTADHTRPARAPLGASPAGGETFDEPDGTSLGIGMPDVLAEAFTAFAPF